MKFVDVVTDCRIECGSFFRGERRLVEDSVAGVLVGSGWAEESDFEPDAEPAVGDVAPVTLDVHNVGQSVIAEDVNGG